MDILVPIELDYCRIKGLAVMKLHPLAQGHFQGAIVDPAPAGSEAWDEFPTLFEIQEVLEDVVHHGDKVEAAAIDNPQLSARRSNLFPYATPTPPEGDQQTNNTANHKVFHDRPSLACTSWMLHCPASCWRNRIQAVASH